MKYITLIAITLGFAFVNAQENNDWFSKNAWVPITEGLIREAVKHTEVCEFYSTTREGEYVIKRKVFPTIPFLISNKLPLTDLMSKCKKKPFSSGESSRWERDDPRWEGWIYNDLSARLACKAILSSKEGKTNTDVIHQCERYFGKKTK